jgi:hypothetical protein
MRQLITIILFCAIGAAAACNPSATSENNSVATNANSTTTTTTKTTGAPAANAAAPAGSIPPVSAAHGGGSPASAPATANANEKPEGIETAALDAKIGKLEAKAKSGSLSDADKKALASAYFERGNIYYNAGQPRLYKFALGDLRRVLRYDPSNEEARAKVDQIVSIYQSMGRPVPENGTEP